MSWNTSKNNTSPEDKELCKCGTPKSEICFIPGTEGCMACHELYLMEQTGVGLVRVDAVIGRAFVL